MKTWNQLFIRQGFMLEEVEENVFLCSDETEVNLSFLRDSLEKGNVVFRYTTPFLTIESSPLEEEKWLELVDSKWRGRGEGLYFRAEIEEPTIAELDTYISGIVRQLNRLGLFTNGSCDGHGKHPAVIYMKNTEDVEATIKVLLASGVKRVVSRRDKDIRLLVTKREQLLDVAEKLHLVQREWLVEDVASIQKQFFQSLLEQLLSINGPSGEENKIRQFVIGALQDYVDHLTVDPSGNILAQKTYRNGNGPTILLNAHLDTVEELAENRIIVKDGSEWTSSAGILGADDRAGIAVILELAKRLENTSFQGKVKFIFTVKEEIGLVGARSVDDYFLWDVDAAIVVDRRGTGDIVVSCGTHQPFCHEKYGRFFEEIAEVQGLAGWKATQGGSSDTRIWAEHGIESVNLSAGYQWEHTEDETLDVDACYNVVQLLQGVFSESRKLQRELTRIKLMKNIGSNKLAK